MYLESILADLNEVMLHGGLIRVNGINVLFDYDTNLNYYGSTTGYHITNSLGYKVYFKCRERSKAQETADIIFGKNILVNSASNKGNTKTRSTRFSTIRKAKRKVISADFSTIGKKRGIIIEVKQFAIIMYTVIEAILPPSFSVITGAAAAVGQITQIKTPSKIIFVSADVVKEITKTTVAESNVRIHCKQICHLRGLNSSSLILQKVT